MVAHSVRILTLYKSAANRKTQLTVPNITTDMNKSPPSQTESPRHSRLIQRRSLIELLSPQLLNHLGRHVRLLLLVHEVDPDGPQQNE